MIKIGTHHPIKRKGKEVGYIQIVERDIPQIEYYLDEEWHNKGVMTLELSQYLATIKDKYPKLLAIVESGNKASKRVLEKCGFLFMVEMKDYLVFVNDLQASKERKEIMQSLLDQGFVEKCKNKLK